ncbi:BON domain-containing protein [Paraburkholderia tropica]|uniref:BON domain-containing protein n=1 Tax=Paraburkholderia tropica TaxID=92647 RepID=UPI002AB62364|nr:BON domain-containing protein [Paraburkholderia tropica]
MKQRIFLRLAAATLCVAASLSAHAQGDNASQTGAAPMHPATSATSKAADRALANDVRHALRAARKQGLKATFIRVRAHDGDVTLTGVVADQKQIDFATSIAQGVSGVRSVTTKITIRDGEGIKGSQ